MRRAYTHLNLVSFLFLAFFFCQCKKNDDSGRSIKEEFKEVYSIEKQGWIKKVNSHPAGGGEWRQGVSGVDKSGVPYGFEAYSFSNHESEYAYAGFYSSNDTSIHISSWLLSSEISVKNGDQVSFYTRRDNGSSNTDRLQVLMSEVNSSIDVGNTPTSVGTFTKVLLEVNPAATPDVYPTNWTKYVIDISGLSTSLKTRIAFRYLPHRKGAKGIGIDLFEFRSRR